jgi:hypothetical protein
MSRTSRSQVRRRRLGAAIVLVVLVAAGAMLAMSGTDDPVAGSAHRSRPGQVSSPQPAPVAAWLAWMPGGFPDGFRQEVASSNELTGTVVVAGDTRWMTASHDADGSVVDRPDPPYAIPIDAFAVDPGEYAPFLPDAYRSHVVDALRDGKAVLGSSSAALRRIGPGGSISFGDRTVEVAIVPDEVVGWSEILVSREVGAGLGIEHDRYLLATAGDDMTSTRFHELIAGLIPAGTPLRTVTPGDTTYVRVASGVNPPVVMKEVFGEFSAYSRSDDPAFLNMSPDWHDANIRTRPVPLFDEPVTCNKALFPSLIGALEQVRDEGLGSEIHVYSGCYAPRTVARSDIAPPSQHAWGAAIDINAPENPYGATPTMDPRIVKIFEHWGFIWGGTFLIPDGMHFEYGSPPPPNG